MRSSGHTRYAVGVLCVVLLTLSILALATPNLYGQEATEFDSYKIRVSGFWFYSNPSGTIQGSADEGTINLQKDLGFNTYSTFTGKIDWKFTHKNHLYLVGSSFDQTRQVALNRTITFQGQTFDVGLSTRAHLNAPLIAPGYEYDFIRRKRGHLGVGVQLDVFDASASLSAAAQVTGDGVHHAAVSARSSLVAPIPVAGPDFRFYLLNSPRLFVEGQVFGMYLFGYGNFLSTVGDVGYTVFKHVSINAGYQLGSRLVVNNNVPSNRIGVHLTQQGPVVGVELSF